MVVTILHLWVLFVVVIMTLYAVRHWYFTLDRMMMRQRPYFQDLYDNDLPPVTVIKPCSSQMA